MEIQIGNVVSSEGTLEPLWVENFKNLCVHVYLEHLLIYACMTFVLALLRINEGTQGEQDSFSFQAVI